MSRWGVLREQKTIEVDRFRFVGIKVGDVYLRLPDLDCHKDELCTVALYRVWKTGIIITESPSQRTVRIWRPDLTYSMWIYLYKRNFHEWLVRCFRDKAVAKLDYRFHLELIGWDDAILHGEYNGEREKIHCGALSVLAAQFVAGDKEAEPYFMDLLKEKSAIYSS